eukprot:1423325-Pyramimonas_sp.AAC.1
MNRLPPQATGRSKSGAFQPTSARHRRSSPSGSAGPRRTPMETPGFIGAALTRLRSRPRRSPS